MVLCCRRSRANIQETQTPETTKPNMGRWQVLKLRLTYALPAAAIGSLIGSLGSFLYFGFPTYMKTGQVPRSSLANLASMGKLGGIVGGQIGFMMANEILRKSTTKTS